LPTFFNKNAWRLKNVKKLKNVSASTIYCTHSTQVTQPHAPSSRQNFQVACRRSHLHIRPTWTTPERRARPRLHVYLYDHTIKAATVNNRGRPVLFTPATRSIHSRLSIPRIAIATYIQPWPIYLQAKHMRGHARPVSPGRR